MDTTAQVSWFKSVANVVSVVSDREGFVFYDEERFVRPAILDANSPGGQEAVLMTLVNGELFTLETGEPPAEIRPLPEGTALLSLGEAAPQG